MEMFAPKIDNDLFQSTLPYGSDIADYFAAGGTAISIHAPLRERYSIYKQQKADNAFQSTLPYGSDLSLFDLIIAHLFQSTLPYGSDKNRYSCLVG